MAEFYQKHKQKERKVGNIVKGEKYIRIDKRRRKGLDYALPGSRAE
jgi:hypothetical protein